MKLSELAEAYGLDVVRDGEFETLGLLLHSAKKLLAFVEDPKYVPSIDPARVSAILCPAKVAELVPAEVAVAVVEAPRRAFYGIHNHFAKGGKYAALVAETYVSPSASIHPGATVARRNVHIGDRCVIEQNVTIAPNTWLGDDVVLRAGTVIGSDGFQFVRLGQEILAVVHAGGVWIDARVEIQSNCCIDRAVFPGFTRIGEDTKIGHLSHAAHNMVIGKRCLIAPHAMLAGSAVLGDDVWIGPSVTVSSGVTVGDRASLTIGAVVSKNVPAGAKVTGNFAIDHNRFIDFMRSVR